MPNVIGGNLYRPARAPGGGFCATRFLGFIKSLPRSMENDSVVKDPQEAKLCPQCSKEIPKGAKKCPFCQSDIRAWYNRHPIVTGLGALFILGMIVSGFDGSHGATSSTPTTPPGPAEARTLGQDAYLRLPGSGNEGQIVCLAPTPAIYDEYGKALTAKDYQGVLDLTDQGLFCVHNGSEVKVIDTSAFLTKVRVVQGADKVDADKVGEAGWSASEWVVTQ